MSDAALTGSAGEASSVREGSAARIPLWLRGLGPLVLVAIALGVFLRFGPVGVFQQAFPPVEVLTIQRVTFPGPHEVQVKVVNGGPEAVTVAQVMVDNANWVHTVDGARTIERLGSRTISIPYPWVDGEPLTIALVTSTGLTFEHVVPVATITPAPTAQYFGTFALLGIYAGVIPVFIGMLWLPFLREIGTRWVDFFLSFTIGLLVFLGVDALAESLEVSAAVAPAFGGTGLVLLGLVGTPLLIAALGKWRRHPGGTRSGFYVAALVALAIGLHNLGEGLAIGSSYATGEIALGTFLVVGFLLHNTTEGLGIVAPLTRTHAKPGFLGLVMLGALAGVPTVLGAWIGGFTSSPLWTTLFLAIGAGAIVQVVIELGKLFARRKDSSLISPMNVAGLLLGLGVMYFTGVLVP